MHAEQKKYETRSAYLQRRSAQLRRKRWERTITGAEEDELRKVQLEILCRKEFIHKYDHRTN